MIMEKMKEKKLLNVMLNAVRTMVEGQIIEAGNTFNYNTTEEIYTKIISRKTAALFGAVSQMVSVLRNDDLETNKEFYEFGLNFGAMFQISDDILDIFSDKSGKEQFNDLKEGKITLPYILLLKEIEEDKKIDFLTWDKNELIKVFEDKKIKEKSLEIINNYYEKCLSFLNKFEDSKYRTILLKILHFIKDREY